MPERGFNLLDSSYVEGKKTGDRIKKEALKHVYHHHGWPLPPAPSPTASLVHHYIDEKGHLRPS